MDIPRSLTDSIGQFVGFAHTCANTLFMNNGDGTFRDESVSMQIGDTGCTLSSLADYDNDGDVDILNVNDFGAWVHPNSLFQNNYPDPFLSIADSIGIDAPIYGMGIAAGDYDKDMDMDYYFTNIGRNVLSRILAMAFMDTTNAANVTSEWVVQDIQINRLWMWIY